MFYVYRTPPPLPAMIMFSIMVKGIHVVLGSAKCIIYNTQTTSSRPMIHALQDLAIYMQKYHKYILPRATMDIFVRAKFA